VVSEIRLKIYKTSTNNFITTTNINISFKSWSSGFQYHVAMWLDTNVLEDHATSILRVKREAAIQPVSYKLELKSN
jgi:hypothetical protein